MESLAQSRHENDHRMYLDPVLLGALTGRVTFSAGESMQTTTDAENISTLPEDVMPYWEWDVEDASNISMSSISGATTMAEAMGHLPLTHGSETSNYKDVKTTDEYFPYPSKQVSLLEQLEAIGHCIYANQ
jgi:hypothetical protein